MKNEFQEFFSSFNSHSNYCLAASRNHLDITYPLNDNAKMEAPIIIEGIQCSVHCGVTSSERRQPQPIVVDLELQCANARAAQSDDLSDTVDYGKIVRRVTEISATSRFFLLESLTERISHTLFQEFPISHLEAWVRKTAPPLEHINGSVGIRLSQSRSQVANKHGMTHHLSEPCPFLLEQYPKLCTGKVLDIATGNGRNAIFLAKHGFSVVGIDRDEEALAHAQESGLGLHDGQFSTDKIDLEANPADPPDLGKEEYDGIIVFFYLFRPLFPKMIQALKPGGRLIYETFSMDNHTVHNHPRNKDFCLNHNELITLTQNLRILHYQDGEHTDPNGKDAAYTVRLVAKKE